MKFYNNKFLKHSNNKDVFLKIGFSIKDTGKKALLVGYWMIQGLEKYWYGSKEELININEKEYIKWQPHTPKGEQYYV